MKKWILFAGILLFLSAVLAAQIQSPAEFFGRYGDRFLPHYEVLRYVEHVAEGSDRVIWQRYGTTTQGRPLGLAIVSAPATLDRLDEWKETHRSALLDPRAELDTSAPVIVWLSHGVHGNEPGATASALKTLYTLAGTDRAELNARLDQTIIILDPCLNPDGYDRYVHFYRSTRGAQPQAAAQSAEHHEPWPYGRVNHYHFDLNRDWLWQTQVESRARGAAFLEWRPHVHVDFHEMYPGSHYFFPPAAKPYLSEFQDWQSDLQEDFGNHNADYFDAENWLYYSHKDFDLFYPSYGDTYPMLRGAIGMTYEQEGHQVAGLVLDKNGGDSLRLRDRIAHHHTAAMATVEKAAELRSSLLKNQYAFYRQKANNEGYYIYSPTTDHLALKAELEALLQRNQIQYFEVTAAPQKNGSAYGDWLQLDKDIRVPKKLQTGDLLIPIARSYPLNRILLEGQHSKATQAALEENPVGDLTAWSAAYFIGDLYRVDRLQRKGIEKTIGGKPAQKINKNFTSTAPAYGYALPLHTMQAYKLLTELLSEGVHVRWSREVWSPAASANIQFQEGTLIVLAADNAEKTYQKAVELIQGKAFPLQSARTAAGPNLGYETYPLIEKPKIALLRSDEFDSYAYGHAWHFLDTRLPGFYHALSPAQFARQQNEYNILLLPGGKKSWSEESLEQFKDFVQAGGRIIALGSSVAGFAGKEFWEIENKPYPDNMDQDEIPGGAVVAMQWDSTSTPQQGMPKTYYSIVRGGERMLWKEKWAILGQPDSLESYSGYMTDTYREYVKETASVAHVSKGSGAAWFFADDPLFRGFWYRGHQLLLNAIFFTH